MLLLLCPAGNVGWLWENRGTVSWSGAVADKLEAKLKVFPILPQGGATGLSVPGPAGSGASATLWTAITAANTPGCELKLTRGQPLRLTEGDRTCLLRRWKAKRSSLPWSDCWMFARCVSALRLSCRRPEKTQSNEPQSCRTRCISVINVTVFTDVNDSLE